MSTMTFNVLGIYFFKNIEDSQFDPYRTTLRKLFEDFSKDGKFSYSEPGGGLTFSYDYSNQSTPPTFAAHPNDIGKGERSITANLGEGSRTLELDWSVEITGVHEYGETILLSRSLAATELDKRIYDLESNEEFKEAIAEKSFRIVFRAIYQGHRSTNLSEILTQSIGDLENLPSTVVFDGFGQPPPYFTEPRPGILFNRTIKSVLTFVASTWSAHNLSWCKTHNHMISSITIDQTHIKSDRTTGIFWQFYRTLIRRERGTIRYIRLYTPPKVGGIRTKLNSFYRVNKREPIDTPIRPGDTGALLVLRPVKLNLSPERARLFFGDSYED